MLLWLSFVLLSAAVLAVLLRPLLRRPARHEPALAANAADQAVYRDQLAEVDADAARGLINPAEAEAARREIARRLLGRADAEPAAPSTAAANSSIYTVATGLIALVPVAAIGLYAALGSPQLPAVPHHARATTPIERTNVDELVARVEARLREHPEDGAGWDVIAPVYLRQERYRDAADAFSNAIRLLGATSRRLAGFAEATIIANNGVVSEEARKAYEEALRLEPGKVEARFWLGMAKEQDGRLAEAAADYRALLADSPANAPWRAPVSDRLATVTQRLGGAEAAAAAKQADRGRGEAPDPSAAAAIEKLPQAERTKAIGDMVDGLAARLKQDGNDLQGWLRLVRAYKVLGRDAAAVAALADARKAMQANPAALGELDALARSLGMGS